MEEGAIVPASLHTGMEGWRDGGMDGWMLCPEATTD